MPGKKLNSLSSQNIVSFFVGAIFAAVVMVCLSMFDVKAGIGFLGVIIGSGISAIASCLVASENRKQQWELAALDKRLEVHQEAYREWQKIMGAVCGGEGIFNTVLEAEKWWNNNCIYLDPASRQAFRDCIFRVNENKESLKKTNYKDFICKSPEIWKQIMKPGQTIPEGVALSHLKEMELGPEHTSQRE